MNLPEIVFGTSGLGNLYVAMPDDVKCAVVEQCIKATKGGNKPTFDSAGKYGAGLALESLGKCLKQLGVKKDEVVISNKLGWLRTPLTSAEPTFEPGVWKELQHDAVQRISYEGILECFYQGNSLLDGYEAEMVSVHDPDEYLMAAKDEADKAKRYKDILEAYRALHELKAKGVVTSVGIGAKDWRVIRQLYRDVALDWVMIANCMTVHSHPTELLDFMAELSARKIPVINSAVFNGGFLTGSSFYNYREVNANADKELYHWRETFFQICHDFDLTPAEASVAFARRAPGVKSIALSTTKPQKVGTNAELVNTAIPSDFWKALAEVGLIDGEYVKNYLTN